MRHDSADHRPSLAIRHSLRRTLLAAAVITGTFFIGLGGWAAYAPLAGAAVAPAVTSPDGNRRQVQHLEGGIVQELLVREGSVVRAGEPLVVLDSTSARASRDILRKELRSLLTLRARLIAERDGADEITFPAEILQDSSEETMTMVKTRRALFDMRRDARRQRKTILERQLGQLEETIVGIDAQIASQDEQLRLLKEETAGVMKLVNEGLERRPRLLTLQRSEAELVGARAEAQASAARTAQAMSETLAEIGAIDTEYMEEVGTKLAEVEAELSGVREKLRAASEVVARAVIKSPVTGTVVELEANTIGGVIAAGETILEIVPRDEEILFDARIAPNDIDDVVPGLPARIVLSAYSQRSMPPLRGTVRQVSADRITDPKTNQPYYLARIELPAEAVAKLPPEVTLKPGMPAEVMVMTSERTVLDYLLEPLLGSFRKSFRES
jgi:HlyD family secretion protein